MPEIEKTITIDSSPDEAWGYLTEMENFSSHLPGFKEFEEVDETTSHWTVLIDLSMFSKELTFEVNVTEKDFPRAEFEMDPLDQPAEGEGFVIFEEGTDGCEITLFVESVAKGRMAPFLNKVIDKALERVADQFAEDLKANGPI